MSGSINAHAPTTVTQTLCSVGFVGFAELGTERRQRPLSAASDPLNDDDMQAHVVDDLEVNGQLKPIVVLDNSHLDGLHRYAACRRLDLCVQFFEPPEGVDPVAIFNSRNLQHRRLKESQRAIAGADCNDWGPSDWSYQCEPAASFSEKALVAREVGASTETSKEVGAVAAKGTPAVEGGVCLRVSVMKTAVEISKLPASGHAAALVSPLPKKRPSVVEQPAVVVGEGRTIGSGDYGLADRYPSVECTYSNGRACRKNLPIFNNVLASCVGVKPAQL